MWERSRAPTKNGEAFRDSHSGKPDGAGEEAEVSRT